MTAMIGRQAVVIGAGIGGLAAAAALAGHFEAVTVLERDRLPVDSEPRPGAPQSNQLHALLGGGLQAFCELLPGFDDDLARTGATLFRMGLDDRLELPGFDPFPVRELGPRFYSLSRPLLEFLIRRRIARLGNVALRDQCRVLGLVPGPDGSVAGLRCVQAGGGDEVLAADLVVDASGRGAPTLAFLQATGWPAVEKTAIGVDIHYVTATFTRTEADRDWKGVVTFPEAPDTKAGYLTPIEGNRWMALISERHGEVPSAEPGAFLALARRLRTSTIYDTLKAERPLGKVHRFAFPESVWTRYERLGGFPRGLVPIGDAVGRFNPVYGQGMTLAAQGGLTLLTLLRAKAGQQDPLDGLGRAFVLALQPLIETAWSAAAVPDFAHPLTRGERPADLERSLHFTGALFRLAARDPEVHRLMVTVRHLLAPASALRDPELVRRIEAEMAAA
ncbi:FAD-dependent oxidoreductase [Inquilinus sp.]|jgi:2-polyprenyl-6-methoxyphenol hydroxylase-like FAD-dependent oxidoreductase|uniref:FAD-dependent oxidoreductase n=1 Tax=Inquilinus sp. TaxID=1932117 RepID=UPI003784E35F